MGDVRVVGLLGVQVAFALSLQGCSMTCTMVGCHEGVEVDVHYRSPGVYVVDAVVDGRVSSCTTTLAAAGSYSCVGDDGLLVRTEQISTSWWSRSTTTVITGLWLNERYAKSITIRVKRDGWTLREATFEPTYVVSPSPNGPDCDPEGCRLATYELR